MKKTFLLAALISSAALFVACGSDKDNDDDNNVVTKSVPAKASVSGVAANACPATTVVLTAAATDATSFAWYNGSEKISDATGATYEVSVSGAYSAAGVNDAGEGAKSDAITVTISTCGSGTYSYSDLLGTYNASGIPSLFEEPGASSWASTVTNDGGSGTGSWYGLTNFGDEDIDIWIDYTDGVLTIDDYTKLGSGSGYDAYFGAFYIDGEYTNQVEGTYEVHYDVATRTLDMSGTYNGASVLLAVVAVSPTTGAVGGFFSDGYANLKFVKTASGAPAFSGTAIKTTPIPGSTLRTIDGVQLPAKMRHSSVKVVKK